MSQSSEFRFAIAAVDVVTFALFDGALQVLLRQTESAVPQYHGVPCLPGAVMTAEENADATLARVLKTKTGIASLYTEQLYTFTDVHRDARSRAIAIAYLGCLRPEVARAHTHATAQFVPVNAVPTLAYDHNTILSVAMKRLASKLLYTTIAQTLLPKKFTLSELQAVYEIVRGETLDKRNFRKKFLSLDVIKETGELQSGVANRPAALYTFTTEHVIEITPVL